MLGLLVVSAVELGQQVAGAALQVGAGEVEVQVREQLPQATVVRRLPEILRVLVQPCAQYGRDGTVGWMEREREKKETEKQSQREKRK